MTPANDIEMIRRFNYWNWYGKPLLAQTAALVAGGFGLALALGVL